MPSDILLQLLRSARVHELSLEELIRKLLDDYLEDRSKRGVQPHAYKTPKYLTASSALSCPGAVVLPFCALGMPEVSVRGSMDRLPWLSIAPFFVYVSERLADNLD